MFDVVVIGGGPAGISAAVYLKRFRLNVLVLMKDYGALGKTDHIENYYGFPEPVTGTQVIENGLAQARRLGVEVRSEEVLGIDNADLFVVKTLQDEYPTKAVLLATGSNRANPRIPGFSDFVGKGISYCAVCDGFLYRKKKIALLGEGDYMAEELEILRSFSDKVTVFTNGLPLKGKVHDVPVVTDPLIKIDGEETIQALVTAQGRFEIDGLFVAIGAPSATDFALKMGALLNKGLLDVDANFMTNIPGLFAAGDCIGGLSQIAKAVSDGAQAAIAINKFVKNQKTS